MVKLLKRLFNRRADRSMHILRKKGNLLSICGVSMKGREHMIYTPNRNDTYRDLMDMRVCNKCIRGIK